MTGLTLGLALSLMLLALIWWAFGGWVVLGFYGLCTAGMAGWYATERWAR